MSETSSNGVDGSGGEINVTWKKLDQTPLYHPRDGHCACSCHGKLYVFGGVVQTSGADYQETNDLLVFDSESLKWEKVRGTGTAPLPRVSATIAAVDNKLYLFGGLSNNVGWLNDFHVFDTESKVWSKPEVNGTVPSPRDKLASAVCDKKIYIFGGFGPKLSRAGINDDEYESDEDEDEDEDDVRAVRSQQKAAQFGWFDDLFVFDTVTLSWSQPMHMNACTLTPRAAHTMCSIGDQLIIFGGRDCDSRTNDLHFYDTVSRKWLAGPAAPRQVEARSFHAACAVGSKVIIFGGRGTQDQHFNDCHIFDIGSQKWLQPKVVGDIPAQRGSHTFTVVGNQMVVYGGSSNFNRNEGQCTKYFSDTYIMQIDFK